MSLGLLTGYGLTTGSAAPAFSPADIAGLLLWLDADDASTITDTGGAVSQWDDKSGNSNHAVQAVGSRQPTTGTVTIGGKNALSFADDALEFTTPITHNAVNRTFFFVMDFNATITAATSTVRVLTSFPSAITDHTMTWFGAVSGVWTDETWAFWQRSSLNQNKGYAVKDTITSGGHIFRESSDSTAASVVMALDGTELTKYTSTSGGFVTGDTAVVRSVGDITGATFRFSELLVYDSVLGSTDIGSVESYLASKWGVTL